MIYLKLLAVACVWGGTFIATRMAALVVGPFEGAFWRFLFATMGLLGVVALTNTKLPRLTPVQWRYHILLALSGIVVYNFFFFSALKLIPASRASLLVSLNPTIILFSSAFLFGEPLKFTKILGGLLSLFGAVVVIARGDLAHIFDHFGQGELLALGCPTSWAVYTILQRKMSFSISPLASTTYTCLLAMAGLLPLALYEGFHASAIPLNVWAALAFLGLLGTVLGFVWYAEGIQTIGATRTSIFNNLVPVFGVLFSVLLLHESINGAVIVGGALVVAGVALIQISNFGFRNAD
ncbi:MAG: DMT family transporter [Saprospiraceae bacterium]|nr:DMT family transporter [Saprospiraceae bacterium]